jgi:T5SS/PEP-CTERM-associated repeat protein
VDFSANANSAFVTDIGTRWLLSSNLYVGSNGSLSRLVITNGARMADRAGFIGAGAASINNTVTVTGPNSVWTNSLDLIVGQAGFGNQLVVSNGGSVVNGVGYFGVEASSSSNAVLITGAGSAWTNRTALYIGALGNGNRLVVTNGGTLRSGVCEIGNGSSGNEVVITDPGSLWYIPSILFAGSVGNGNRLTLTNGGRVLSFGVNIGYSGADNLAVVTGPGSAWTNFSGFQVGQSGPRSILIVTNGGQIVEAQGFITGVNPSSINNRVVVEGGTLRVQNLDGSAYEVRRGTNVLTTGLIEAARLLLTNSQGFFEFNGGTLSVGDSQLTNGTIFRIGNGVSPATFILSGNGFHDFTGIPSATVSSNATLTGNGTIAGSVILSAGSTLAPGSSIGRLTFSNSPSLHGKTVMEISREVPPPGTTNDQIQAIGTLTYGGTLTVTNIGTNALAVGDRFQLFNAPAYAGGFTSTTLPPLPLGLTWKNRLIVDGSIEIGGLEFTQIGVSGGIVTLAGSGGTPGTPYAILTATNVTDPLSNWVSLATNTFNPAGKFVFTNGTAGETQRFFRIRIP